MNGSTWPARAFTANFTFICARTRRYPDSGPATRHRIVILERPKTMLCPPSKLGALSSSWAGLLPARSTVKYEIPFLPALWLLERCCRRYRSTNRCLFLSTSTRRSRTKRLLDFVLPRYDETGNVLRYLVYLVRYRTNWKNPNVPDTKDRFRPPAKSGCSICSAILSLSLSLSLSVPLSMIIIGLRKSFGDDDSLVLLFTLNKARWSSSGWLC